MRGPRSRINASRANIAPGLRSASGVTAFRATSRMLLARIDLNGRVCAHATHAIGTRGPSGDPITSIGASFRFFNNAPDIPALKAPLATSQPRLDATVAPPPAARSQGA